MLYFAYGSNLNHKQLKRRCPSSNFLSTARLTGYELVFNGFDDEWGGAVANVVPCAGSTVQGAIFEVSAEDMKKLDNFEYDYRRCEVRVEVKNKQYQAITYERKLRDPGEPSEKYLEIIKQGYKDCGLSSYNMKVL